MSIKEKNNTPSLVREKLGVLWDDISDHTPEKNDWPLLAHYTSFSNLKNILESEKIWFSHPRSMNDVTEQRFGFQKFRQAVNYSPEIEKAFNTNFSINLFLTTFNQHCALLEDGYFDNFFVFCLSEHEANDTDGPLSMWRGYGAFGGGVALVIDPKKVKEVDDLIMFGKVQYPTEEYQISWINNTIKKFTDIIIENKLGRNYSEIIELNQCLFHRLRVASLYSKHLGFIEEKEWRLACHKDSAQTSNRAIELGYIVRDSGIEPTVKCSLVPEKQKFTEIIERIIIGPSAASFPAKEATENMLRKIGKEELIDKVVLSKIPFSRPRKPSL